ncbi:MAG: NYN domain-containing protein [Pseudonocardiaceae bacterium]
MDPRVCVVIDYQNIHLTARDLFAPPGLPAHECLIHPLWFAEQVIALRATRQRDEIQQRAVLTAVRVFRGSPSNARDPYVYGISQRQRSEWTRDKRVDVVYRTLRYPPDWPNKPAREKGVDVLVALKVVRAALDPQFDVVILASHDTDLEPALEIAIGDGQAKIETAGWHGARVLRPSGARLWHTALDAADMDKTRDQFNYAPPRP